jgi:hypothetical protein
MDTQTVEQIDFDELATAWINVVIDRLNGDEEVSKTQYAHAKRDAWAALIDLNPSISDWLEEHKSNFPYPVGVKPEGNAYLGSCLHAAVGRAIQREGIFDRIKPTTYVRRRGENTILNLVRTWVDENDYLPPYAIMAHFSGAARTAFYTAKYLLTDEGYEFERGECGRYNVVARPVDEKEQEIQELVRQSELLQQQAERLRAQIDELRVG